jgi:hypothetical protein
MKVTGTDGKKYTWQLAKYVGNKNTNPSELHLQVREFLAENYPALQILEEVYIESEKLYIDFYISLLKIAIEVQGRQHDNFSLFMHKNKLGFSRAKGRDNRKAEFCRINGIKLIYFYPEEEIDEWKTKMGLKTT